MFFKKFQYYLLRFKDIPGNIRVIQVSPDCPTMSHIRKLHHGKIVTKNFLGQSSSLDTVSSIPLYKEQLWSLDKLQHFFFIFSSSSQESGWLGCMLTPALMVSSMLRRTTG